MHRRGYEGISALWKKFGKLKSFQSLCCRVTSMSICRKANLLGKGWKRATPSLFAKALSRRRSPTSIVITMSSAEIKLGWDGPNASSGRGSEPITSGF